MRWNAREDMMDSPGAIGFDAAAILMVPKVACPGTACIFLAKMRPGAASGILARVTDVQDGAPSSVPACAAMMPE